MDKLNDLLHELGISKVKLAKFLGVSRQMIYNYLDLEDLNKWPRDKKVLLFNLLGIKSADEINNIKVDTDYILKVEERLNLIDNNTNNFNDKSDVYDGLSKKQKELLHNIIELIKEDLDDDKDEKAYNEYLYLYHFIQVMKTSNEPKYMLAYVSKTAGFTKPLEFAFNEKDQYVFEAIMYTAMVMYNNGGASSNRIAEYHKKFIEQIDHRIEEKIGRTQELYNMKDLALKELGYNSVDTTNLAEVLKKIAEIESRRMS